MPALLSIFGEIERLMAELYPYRYVITPLMIAGAAGLVALAISRGAHLYLWRHRTASAMIGAPALVVAIFAGNYLLSPLWERSFLEEESPLSVLAASPTASVPVASTPSAATNPPAEVDDGKVVQLAAGVTHQGEFEGTDAFHFGRGQALIIRTDDGSYILRFENFSIRNGPDLFVYLSEDPDGKKVSEELNLGDLKATDGAFNYEIPDSVDLSLIKSAVVWCRQFGVLFAYAELYAE